MYLVAHLAIGVPEDWGQVNYYWYWWTRHEDDKKNGILGRHFLLESLSIKKLLKKNWSASALFSRFHLCSIYQCIQNLLSIWQNIPCCCDEAAMEVMWGVENLLHILVPDEETELREDDRTLRSKGLHMFLQSLGYNIEKELVSKNTCLYGYPTCNVSALLQSCKFILCSFVP